MRSFLHKSMDLAWMQRLLMALSSFVDACHLKAPATQHTRGYFAQVILGMAHGMGENKNVCNHQQVPLSLALLTIHT
jgi:hypothetical protein